MSVAVLRLFAFFTEPALSANDMHRIDGEPDREATRPSAETREESGPGGATVFGVMSQSDEDDLPR